MSKWYLLRCKPHEDKRACNCLEDQGYTVYCPYLWVNKSRTLEKKLVYEALFPGYIFINLDKVHSNWVAVRSTRGVRDLVRFGDHTPTVGDSVIASIMDQVKDLEQSSTAVCGLAKGDKVKVTSGSFEGLTAIYQQSSGKDRARVLIDFMGRQVETNVRKPFLSKISGSHNTFAMSIG